MHGAPVKHQTSNFKLQGSSKYQTSRAVLDPETRRLFGAWSFLVFMALVAPPAAYSQTPPPSEYTVKAAFLFNFAKFVEWPPETFSDPASPFAIGIIGENPFDSNLQHAVENKNINGHPLVVKQIKQLSELNNCQILFISISERKRLPEILKSIQGAGVLTVSEMDHFLEGGGMIQFLMEERRVRFAINDQAARKTGLRISSKLLHLARRTDSQEQQ
jgi:hypothetical protein